MNIAIQGGRGSFHDIAARYHFGEGIQITECSGFRILCEELKHNDSVDYAVMAIENSIAASILTNYALIQEYQLQIIGEVYLGIKQYIMVHPESKKSDVKYVMSHYMALNQCEDYLLQHPDWVRKEYHDTADSAKYILENNIKDTAAIASKYAAEIYGLKLLEKESIETYKENFTRFFILTTDKKKRIKEANKATISFRLADKVGALAEVLKIIVDNGVNLSKIQSLPVFGQVNAYRFYVDCEWKEYETFKKSIAINSLVEDLTVLGEYIKGDFVHDYSSSR
ncbi:MAG: prephenate dehydratase [Cytophagaceae bacterium]|jgi:prephenate dehydratase|nr:prephenate dehydratase [Cytophagaceae bacterium]